MSLKYQQLQSAWGDDIDIHDDIDDDDKTQAGKKAYSAMLSEKYFWSNFNDW